VPASFDPQILVVADRLVEIRLVWQVMMTMMKMMMLAFLTHHLWIPKLVALQPAVRLRWNYAEMLSLVVTGS
jgi:hypothetical protein